MVSPMLQRPAGTVEAPADIAKGVKDRLPAKGERATRAEPPERSQHSIEARRRSLGPPGRARARSPASHRARSPRGFVHQRGGVSAAASPLDPIVAHVLERVLVVVREELERARTSAPDRLVRADDAGLGKTPRASARAVRRLADAGELSAVKLGKTLFVRAGELAAFVEARRVTPRPARVVARASDLAPAPTPSGVDALADELGLMPVKAKRTAGGRGR